VPKSQATTSLVATAAPGNRRLAANDDAVHFQIGHAFTLSDADIRSIARGLLLEATDDNRAHVLLAACILEGL
jgi:hypothetical protein